MWMNREVRRLRSKKCRLAAWFSLCVLSALTWTGSALAQVNPDDEPTADAQLAQAQPPTDQEEETGATPQPREVVPPAAGGQEQRSTLPAGLDTTNVNLSGAELSYKVVNDQLILTGSEDDLDLIEALIMILEETREAKNLRVVKVTEKDANEIARTVEPTLRDMFYEPNQPEEDRISVAAVSSRIILVSALPEQIDFVVELIKQVDEVEEDEIGKIEQLVFPVKHRKASDVAEQLREIISKIREKQGARGPESELQIIANNANNSIMVLAPESEREKIQKLLNEIDVEPVKGWGEVKLTLFPLLHSKANDLANVINDLLAQEDTREAAEEVIFRLQISKALPSGEIIDLSPIDLQKPTRIIPDDGTNSLIVATVEENVKPMQELIQLLDGVPAAEELGVKLFPLRFADAETVKNTLNEMFDQGKQLPEDPDGSGSDGVPEGILGHGLVYNVGLSVDVRSNTLIVTGRQEQLLLAEMIVSELDRPATALKFPLRMIQLEHSDATRIGQIMTELFDQRFAALEATDAGRAALERERVFMSVDIRSNSLIVSASEENYEELVIIASQLDTRPVRLFDQIRIINCRRMSAADLKQKIEELWQRKADLRREEELLEDLPILVADERSNALIIASSIEDFEEIKQLVGVLEAQPLIDDMQLFELEYADATVLADMLDELFQGMEGQLETFKAPTIMPDPRSNALVVAGMRDTMERVEDVITRLDVEAGPMTAVFKVYPLKHGSSAKLGPRMQELFDSRAQGDDRTRTPIVIFADESSNSLVCSASRDDHELIVDLLGKLDTPSSIAKQFTIFPLKTAKATRVAEKLDALFQSQAEGASGRADAIAVETDERTNSLIVWASPSEMQNIGEMIERLDTSTPAVEMMVKIIQLEQAVAEDLVERFNETLLGEDPGGDDERAVVLSFIATLPDGREVVRQLLRQDIHIAPDPRTNSLMVMAPVESMDVLEALIHDFDKRLDVEVGPMTAVYKVYPLQYGSATKLAPRMQELFDSRTEGDDQSRTPVLVLADESSNSLVCSASRDDHEILMEMLGILDKPSSIAKQFQIFPLKMAKATRVAEKLDTLFQSQAEGASGRADAIAVETDERTNSLIVWASPSEMENIREVIERLDTSTPVVEMMVKIIQLKQALAEDFAQRFTETVLGEDPGGDDERAVILSFSERLPDGSEVTRKLLRQDVRIEPDPRTNSLMVMAPAESMDMLEIMIRDFDKTRPIQSEIRLFPLVNSDAENMVENLTDLFEAEGAGTEGETLRQFHFGEGFEDIELASVGQELRFAADSRTNTLIVAGAEIDLRMVEELIRYLDAQEAEDRIVEVIHAKYRDAQDLASAIDGFNQQEQDVLGAGDDEESLQRRMERQVSVEAVGDEEEGSSNLIVGTSRRMYQQTMEMIHDLDRPEPQVMISVLIAEVKLSDSVELGMEIAGQDLQFSEEAIIGPNGIIQGPNFDYVIGTDVGALARGLGGLNFTMTGEDFSFLFHAAQLESRVETLSRPIILVRNGEEGKITIANRVPFVSVSGLSDTGQTQSQVSYEDVGVVLTATPQISPDGYVTIELKQEVSGFAGENVQLTEGVSSPVFLTREVDTNVTLRDGETVIIGGLITSQDSEGENKVPILGDLPLLGPLFRVTSVSRDKNELLLILTVDILRTDEQRHRMSIEQRDKFLLPDSIRQNPLMEGLRILPEEAALGPVDEKSKRPGEAAPKPEARPEKRDLYGPKPKVYGPVIRRPTTTTAMVEPVYGPRIARSETFN